MSVADKKSTLIVERPVKEELLCYHCGAPCISDAIAIDDKLFCCEGCKLVYEILDENGLCDYYKIQNHPGLTQIKALRSDKYAYLDNEEIAQRLYKFTDGSVTIVTLYLPGIHCSSCLWLLEHLHKIREGIIESRVNFSTKEITIRFRKDIVSLRQLVELLATVGYEPYISLEDVDQKKARNFNRQKIYKLGVAGFCFGNIMLLSFPEYLSDHTGIEHQYVNLFRYLNVLLSLPVFFYSATEFFSSAWAGIRQKMLNIDAPIVLALLITYSRSLFEIFSGVGGGYLDSMSGIVFFMLVGRIVQERTYKSISFHRDYKSYFPIAVNVITDSGVVSKSLQDLKEHDRVQLYNDEIIPADSVLETGSARVDYSFVTGESEPVAAKQGAMLYAGGRQVGEQITIRIVKPVAGSYLTSLWNHYAFQKNKAEQNKRESFIHKLSTNFTYGLLVLAAATAAYWAIYDPSKILPSVSAMLIVACPCALLLASTYTNGSLLRIFSINGLFLRDATVIEQLGKIDHIVFDKTGTLTRGSSHLITSGHQLTDHERTLLYNLVKSSRHPNSKALQAFLGERGTLQVSGWKEHAGKGVEATIGGYHIKLGNAAFTGVSHGDGPAAAMYALLPGGTTAFYLIPDFRESIPQVIPRLDDGYRLSLLSGDNDRQKEVLQELFSSGSQLLFEQKPIDKLHYVEQLQQKGDRVMMVGDGLNDAGALQQSNVGVTLADDINNFTPSCDAILDAGKFASFPGMMKLSKAGKHIINFSFLVSVLYNLVGLAISVQGKMNPLIAAILMPASTITIVLISTGASSLVAKRFGLSFKGS